MPVIQRIRRILAILLPMIFPTAISLLPFIAAVTLTTSSGRDVPKATIVRPMIRVETPNFLAIEEAPRTRMSAPHTRMRNPITTKKKLSTIKRN
jgi:hypothetical protein